MPVPLPKRPWWRRKRTWAAGTLWLLVAYPLSVGPANYVRARDWLPAPCHPALDAFYRPLLWATKNTSDLQSKLVSYGDWWYQRGVAHWLDERTRERQQGNPSHPAEP